MKLITVLLLIFSSTIFAWSTIGISKIDKKKEALTIVPIFDWDTKGLALIYDF